MVKPRGYTYVFFFLLWLFYCLQVYTLYQSLLISFLANAGSYPPIRSLSDLNDSDIDLVHYGGFAMNNNHTLFGEWYKKPIKVNTTYQTDNKNIKKSLDEVIKGNSALMSPHWQTQLYAIMLYKKNHKELFSTIEETTYSIHVTISFFKESCFCKRVNTILHYLHSSGLIKRKLEEILQINNCYRFSTVEDLGVYVITLNHLQGAFYILLIGLITSSLQFYIEIRGGRVLNGLKTYFHHNNK